MTCGLVRFPFARDLAGFDFSAQPSIDRAQVREIAGSRFVIASYRFFEFFTAQIRNPSKSL
jgi:hypothetical protein